jgi:hypothetical protein
MLSLTHIIAPLQRGIVWKTSMEALFTDDLYEHAFFAPPVELTVEDLFPRPKVEIAISNGDHHLASHDLALQVGVSVVLTGAIVAVMGDGFMRGKLLKPVLVVLVEPGFVIVDKDAGSDMHGVDKTEALSDATFFHCLSHIFRDVDEVNPCRDIEPKLFAKGFHLCLLLSYMG